MTETTLARARPIPRYRRPSQNLMETVGRDFVHEFTRAVPATIDWLYAEGIVTDETPPGLVARLAICTTQASYWPRSPLGQRLAREALARVDPVDPRPDHPYLVGVETPDG